VRYFVIVLTIVCGSVSLQAQDQDQFWSAEKEKALGTQMASEVRHHTTPLGLVDVDSYVQNLGQRLAGQMRDAHGDWLFSVIREHRIGSTCEPIALPGGYLFVSAQLILAAENEAEFAGMLAHSVAHVAQRHGFSRVRRGDSSQPATIPLIFLGGAGFGDDENNLLPFAILRGRRQLELEADQFALSTMAAAGYNPRALFNYIRRVRPQLPVDDSLSALPSLSRRIANLEAGIQNLSGFSPQASTESFRSIQERVRIEMARSVVPSAVPSLIHR
jgi:predicted Zn-dependent protease